MVLEAFLVWQNSRNQGEKNLDCRTHRLYDVEQNVKPYTISPPLGHFGPSHLPVLGGSTSF